MYDERPRAVTTFGALLRQRRQQAGMTQEALAEHAGVGVRTIRGLETGERTDPRVATVRLLADALQLTPRDEDELLGAAVGRATEEPAVPDATGSALRDALADAAEHLAHAVAARWQREEEHRQVQDPFPLPVRWRPADDELTDHWANIRSLPPGSVASPLELAGRLDEIADTYRRIPSGRLVLLGRSGSGKTVLTVRFVLDFLKSRARTEPVPVIFGVGSWNPTTVTLRDWLAGQLTRDHPGLAAASAGGQRLATALVEAGLVLPVLDGFDEIAGGLRRAALEALNATALPLLLTSRPDEYAAEADVLTSAAAVELADLTLDDLADYLPRTARKAGGSTAWDPVLAELREHPGSRASVNLTTVLTTPLMVTLARASYSDTPGRDPATLLDTERFGSGEALADHLLDSFVPSVYRHRPGAGDVPRHRFDPDRARRWLGYLAHHLTRRGSTDLGWWQLGGGLRRSTRTIVTALVTGLAVGLVDALVGATFNPPGGQLVDGAVVAILSGLMFGLAHWLTVAARDAAVAPAAVRMTIRRRRWQSRLRTGPRLMIGFLCGLVFGAGYGGVVGAIALFVPGIGASVALRVMLADSLVYGLVFGLAAGLAFGLLGLLEAPLDIGSAVSPLGLLGTNRRSVAAWLLVWAPTFGLMVMFGSELVVALLQGLVGPLAWSLQAGFRLGLLSGLGGALGYTLALTAWGQWAILARIWLPLTGRLPWSVAAFLDDAYRRGVLRQAGAVYQFRHAQLQHHLARTHRVRRADLDSPER